MSFSKNTETQIYGPPGDLPVPSDLREEYQAVRKLFDLAEERLRAIENRLEPVETAIAKIPGIEARLSRVDKMLLELQGDMRRLEKSSNAHSEKIETKLDELKTLLLARRDG